MENKKLSTEEVATLKNYQETTNEIVGGLGQIKLNIELLEQKEDELLERFRNLQKSQTATAEELTKKYGDGNLDLEKGEFIPAK
tara:strand:+ start:388 stop:639 length:252 start_codon:yes stop_codon:yes gene_type:complete